MKLLLSKLIAILFAFILFNSNVIASTFEIKKNRLLLARRVRMNRMEPGPTEEKVINTVKEAKEVKEVNEVNKVNKVKTKLNKAEFVINALASTLIFLILH